METERERERKKEGVKERREGEPSLLCFFTQSSQRKRRRVNLT